MEKVKKLLSKISSSVQEAFERFPVTIIIVYFLTIIAVIEPTGEFYFHIMFIATVWTIGTFFVESLLEKPKSLEEGIGVLITFVISFIFDRLFINDTSNVEIYKWFGVYIFTMSILGLYFLLRKSKARLEEYYLRLSKKFWNVTLTYLVLEIGITLIFSMITMLLFENIPGSLIERIFILISGFFYVPSVISSFIGKDEDVKSNKKLTLRVLLPLLTIAVLIVYLYIFKIFVLTEIPKNIVFMLVAILYIIGFWIYIRAKNCEGEGKVYDKIIKAIPIAYIPLVILQIYALGIRISNYGLTISRYMGIIFIIVESMFIFLILYKNGKYLNEILLVINAIIILITVTPFNLINVPNWSQAKILDEYVENGIDFNDLDEKDKKRYSGAYKYLDGMIDSEDYINEDLDKEDIEKFKKYNNSGFYYDYDDVGDDEDEEIEQTDWMSNSRDIDNLNIADYKKIYKFSTNGHNEINHVGVSTDLNLTCDFEEYFNDLMDGNEKSYSVGRSTFNQIDTIETNDSKYDLYVNNIFLEYYKGSKKVKEFRVSGYILEK